MNRRRQQLLTKVKPTKPMAPTSLDLFIDKVTIEPSQAKLPTETLSMVELSDQRGVNVTRPDADDQVAQGSDGDHTVDRALYQC